MTDRERKRQFEAMLAAGHGALFTLHCGGIAYHFLQYVTLDEEVKDEDRFFHPLTHIAIHSLGAFYDVVSIVGHSRDWREL